MQHTSGPWGIYPGGGTEEFKIEWVRHDGRFLISNQKGPRPIASVNCWENQPYSVWTIPADEAVANARLIAAAPDLLEALKTLVALNISTVPLRGKENIKHDPGCPVGLASDLIAKAEGETQ
tara:strand:+ start:285 stop:650 length:366 start_codon:yes stop_codon:yes gene_type:complete